MLVKRYSGDRLGGDPIALLPPGAGQPADAVIVDVKWRHLPNIGPFSLTDQTGQPFRSADMAGRPYAACFFFATCPTICQELNQQVQRLEKQLSGTDLKFLSISVDPEHDTPEVLRKYAAQFGADPQRWAFLTGTMDAVKEVGEKQFQVVIDKEFHNDNILLVDKWGRYRDRFKWDSPDDIKRFLRTAKQVAAEEEVPLFQTFSTRNALAGMEPQDLSLVPAIREFWLTDSSGDRFYSRDMTGTVWIASFFSASCKDECQRQLAFLEGLQRQLKTQTTPSPTRIVSITTDPVKDSLSVLEKTAADHGAEKSRWTFCTGGQSLIPRIGDEFFGASALPHSDAAAHATTDLFVIDRWGNLRGRFDWQKQGQGQGEAMLKLISQLWVEKSPNEFRQSLSSAARKFSESAASNE